MTGQDFRWNRGLNAIGTGTHRITTENARVSKSAVVKDAPKNAEIDVDPRQPTGLRSTIIRRILPD